LLPDKKTAPHSSHLHISARLQDRHLCNNGCRLFILCEAQMRALIAAKSGQLLAPCNGVITGYEIMSKLKCGIRNTKALPRMAKPLVLRHGRRITCARFSARLISYSLFPTLLRCREMTALMQLSRARLRVIKDITACPL